MATTTEPENISWVVLEAYQNPHPRPLPQLNVGEGTEKGAVFLSLARACGPGLQAQAGRGRRATLREQNRSPGEGAGAARANRPAPRTELLGMRARVMPRNLTFMILRPTLEELRQDMRALMQACRQDYRYNGPSLASVERT